MKKLIFMSLCVLLLAFVAAPAKAVVREGEFWIVLEGDNDNWNTVNEDQSGGDGYQQSSPWYEYDYDGTGSQQDAWGNVNPVPGWVNQWWYNDPPDPDRWKEVTITFNYALDDITQQGYADIAINYTSLDFPESGPDGAPPMSNLDPANSSIVWIPPRINVKSVGLEADDEGVYNFSQTFDLRDYCVNFNPEWISVDVAGYNFKMSDSAIPGSIIHECVPEPATIMLLGLGGLVLRKRRTEA